MLFLSSPGRNFSHIGFPSGKRRGIFTSNLSLRCSLDVGLVEACTLVALGNDS